MARHPFDWHVEPKWAVEAFFDAVPIVGSVGDPCCGQGTIPEVARARGHDIVAADIVDRGYPHMAAVADFLADPSPFAGIANIIMNPPYGYRPRIAEMFVRQALSVASSLVAIVVPIRWLAGEVRFTLFADHPPMEFWVHSERPSMPPGDKIAELGKRAFKGGRIDYAWITWHVGRRGDGVTRFIPPRPKHAR